MTNIFADIALKDSIPCAPAALPFAYTAFISVVDGEIIETLHEQVLSSSLHYDLSEECGSFSPLNRYANDLLKKTFSEGLKDTVYRVFVAGHLHYKAREDWETGITEYAPVPQCTIQVAEYASQHDIDILDAELAGLAT